MPDCVTVELPVGGRVVVTSDLFLGTVPSRASLAACRELASALDAAEGSGALVVAGNFFQLGGEPVSCEGKPVADREATAPPGAGPAEALRAHGDLEEAVRRYLTRPGRRAVLLPGTQDRALCYDATVHDAAARLGFEVALAAEVSLWTPRGPKLVRVEPGWRFDSRHSFADPRDRNDTPLGQHVLREVFRSLRTSKSGWLEGVDRLQDPAGLPRFVASRLAYRRMSRFAWWLLLPAVVAAIARLPELWFFGVPAHLQGYARPLAELVFTLAFELVAIFGVLAVVNHKLWAGPGSALLGPPGDRANDRAREAARELVEAGYAGLVTGHTLQAELVSLGRGFFANTGACGEVVEERKAILGMPPVFVHERQVSFVEIEAGAEVHCRLLLARHEEAAATVAERLLVGRRRAPLELSVVAAFPNGLSWPTVQDPIRRHRPVRRVAAAIVGLVGLADLVSALVPYQVRGRLHPYLGYVPLGASALAGALDALAGLALLLMARGLRRGQRIAWAVAVTLLGVTSLLHILREGQVLESIAALAVLGGLVWARDSFRARYDPPSLRYGVQTLVGGALAITLLVSAVLEIALSFDRDRHPLAFQTAFLAAAERLVGIDSVSLPHPVGVFLDPALLAVGFGLAVVALLLAFRPVVDGRRSSRPRGSRSAIRPRGGTVALAPLPLAAAHGDRAGSVSTARDVVQRRGSGTLDYFALRSDKQHFFARDGVVAYAIHSGVCLVSPDPIGPVEERRNIWAAFRRFADEHGWTVAVLGAGEEWLPIYHRSGLRSLYIGDEAVVEVDKLSLDGGAKKGLRQAVNRIAKYGYTISFHDPASVSDSLASELRSVMEKSRRGGVERGFSMTLGRMFDPSDTGLLLAVAHAPDGHAVAFCQYVPAPGIGGYSLDLMRREPEQHPNGLLDFILVRTIEHLRDMGASRLGLNFAMMRAVLAGEAGDGLSTKMERWLLRRMSDTMQIESLWRFNAKFDPEWLARYVVWDSAEQSLVAALAIARAESFWEIPLIGRFLVPAPREASTAGLPPSA